MTSTQSIPVGQYQVRLTGSTPAELFISPSTFVCTIGKRPSHCVPLSDRHFACLDGSLIRVYQLGPFEKRGAKRLPHPASLCGIEWSGELLVILYSNARLPRPLILWTPNSPLAQVGWQTTLGEGPTPRIIGHIGKHLFCEAGSHLYKLDSLGTITARAAVDHTCLSQGKPLGIQGGRLRVLDDQLTIVRSYGFAGEEKWIDCMGDETAAYGVSRIDAGDSVYRIDRPPARLYSAEPGDQINCLRCSGEKALFLITKEGGGRRYLIVEGTRCWIKPAPCRGALCEFARRNEPSPFTLAQDGLWFTATDQALYRLVPNGERIIKTWYEDTVCLAEVGRNCTLWVGPNSAVVLQDPQMAITGPVAPFDFATASGNLLALSRDNVVTLCQFGGPHLAKVRFQATIESLYLSDEHLSVVTEEAPEVLSYNVQYLLSLNKNRV